MEQEKTSHASGPYLCIAPACGDECGQCTYAISPQEVRTNAIRYELLQRMDPRFGMPVEWLRAKSLNEAVDGELERIAKEGSRT